MAQAQHTMTTNNSIDNTTGAADKANAKSKRSQRIANKRKDSTGKANAKPTIGLSPFAVRVLTLLRKPQTRRELIVATGRGTGWAALFGAHTKGAATKVPGTNDHAGENGLLARGLVTRDDSGVYSLTAAGKKAIA